MHQRRMLQTGQDLVKGKWLLYAQVVRYQAASTTWDQQCAEDHRQACQALDRTPAGRRARDLLFHILTPGQRFTAERYHYFDLWLTGPYESLDDPEFGRYIDIYPIRFRFYRGFPNGNIKLALPPNWRQKTICLHPVSPYPNDDIILSQMMMLLTEPDEFAKQANIIDSQGRLKEYDTMFGESPEPERLVLPHIFSAS